MAKEIQTAYDKTGRTVYALIRDTTGSVWSVAASAFQAYSTGALGNYDIVLTEQGTASRYYAGDMPALSAGVYNIAVYDQIGANPSEADSLIAAGQIHWDGSAVLRIPSGVSTLTQADIRTALGLASANLDSQLAAIDNLLDTEIAAILAAVDTEIASIKAKTDNLPATPAATGDAMTLTGGERTTLATAILDLANGIESSITPRGALRLILAACAGKLSGAATTTVTIRNVGDTKDRIVATVDSDGNRTAVTTDGS